MSDEAPDDPEPEAKDQNDSPVEDGLVEDRPS